MGVPVDITGHVFGRLTAIARLRKRPPGEWVWSLTCVCGGTKEATVAQLRAGNVQSCGCLARESSQRLGRRPRREHPDLTGQTFRDGQITIMGPEGSAWRCLCRCGNRFVAKRHALTSGKVKSCGCLPPERVAPPPLDGQSFHHLTVLRSAAHGDAPAFPEGIGAYCLCRCVCGAIVVTTRRRLLAGSKQSCGCQHNARAPHLTEGEQHGRLTVLGLVRDGIRGSRLYRCRCVCGISCVRTDEVILRGSSCGCGRKKKPPSILHEVFGERLSTADLASIAGMKPSTLYARVARGLGPAAAAFGPRARSFPVAPKRPVTTTADETSAEDLASKPSKFAKMLDEFTADLIFAG